MEEILSNGVCVCERSREESKKEKRKINSRNRSRMQQNGVYRNIASVLNSIKLDEVKTSQQIQN